MGHPTRHEVVNYNGYFNLFATEPGLIAYLNNIATLSKIFTKNINTILLAGSLKYLCTDRKY